MTKNDFRIIFMGTPDFAVQSLKTLYESGFNIVAVITVPDKPAGRGRKIQQSDVKKYALQENLTILQPTNLKNETFIKELQTLRADLQVVVAFRMLPEIVWAMPKYGTVNLHASLLPQYRGAAPINHAIINGETETGVTTFFIEKEIDTGNIIAQSKVKISADENAGELHDKLMFTGGELILTTVENIMNGTIQSRAQKDLSKNKILKPAPKIFPDDCLIYWDQPVKKICDFIRGLSPYPVARTIITGIENKSLMMKIFKTKAVSETHSFKIGKIISDNKSFMKIAVKDGYIDVLELQIQGKKRMSVKDLLNGFDISQYVIKIS